jgi:hypothetical protein
MAKFFTAEGLVIITSKDEVSAFQWRKYVEKNWDDLKQKNAVILILAGIHGKQDGKLGNPDLGWTIKGRLITSWEKVRRSNHLKRLDMIFQI